MNLQAMVEALGWTLVHFLWQGVIVALLLGAVMSFVSQSTIRYLLATGALVLLVVSFGVTFSVVQKQSSSDLGQSSGELAPLEKNAGVVETEGDLSGVSVIAASEDANDLGTTVPTVAATVATVASEVGDKVASWHIWVVVIWLVGVALFALRIFLDWRSTFVLKRTAQPLLADDEWKRRFSGLVGRLGISIPVQLLTSVAVRVPLVLGVLRPVVIVPAAMLSNLPAAQVDAILLHELAHVWRHDFLVNLLQSLIETAFFFHPAVWWISRRIREERENCCDDLASATCGDVREYAGALAALEESRAGMAMSLSQAADGGRQGSLLMRVRRLLGDEVREASVLGGWPTAVLGVALAATAVFLLVSLGGPVVAAEDTDAEQEDWRDEVTVPFAIEVKNTEDQLVADAEVWVWEHMNSAANLDDRVHGHGRTDAEGVFYFEASLTKSPHILYAMAKGNDQVGIRKFSSEKIAEDSEMKASVTLRPTEPAKVRVILPNGRPAKGVRLWVARMSVPRGQAKFADPPLLPNAAWQVVTDAEGRAEFLDVPKGAYLYLDHDQEEFAHFDGVYEVSGRGVLAGGDEKQLHLRSGGKIIGRIVLPDGTPVDNAHLWLTEHDPYVVAYGGNFSSGENGRFVITRVPASSYQLAAMIGWSKKIEGKWIGPGVGKVVVVESETTDLGDMTAVPAIKVTARILDAKTGEEIEAPMELSGFEGLNEFYYRGQRIPPQGYGDPIIGTVSIELKAGQEEQIEFRLPPVKGYTGTVRDEQGEPVKGAIVNVSSFPALSTPRQATTDGEGKYAITPPEDVRNLFLVARSEGRSLVSLLTEVDGSKDGAHDLVVMAEGFAKISGTVVDDAGDPIADVRVSLSIPGQAMYFSPFPSRVTTDASGQFEWPRFWPDTEIELEVRKSGWYLPTKEGLTLTTKGDEETKLKFELRRANQSISGVVLHHDGTPAVGASLTSSIDARVSRAASIKTDADGRFEMPGLIAGEWTITARMIVDGYSSAVAKSVVVGEDKEVQLQLRHFTKKLFGRIVTEEGKAVAYADLSLWAPGISRDGKTDGEGKFEILGLDEKWGTLMINPQGGRSLIGQRYVRVKASDTEAEIVFQDPSPDAPQVDFPKLPEQKRDMIGTTANPINVRTWLNTGEKVPNAQALAGRVRIVDLFYIASHKSRTDFSKLQEFWKKHGDDERLQLIAIASDTNPLEIDELFEDKGYTFPVGILPRSDHVNIDYDWRKSPTYVVIDSGGKIVAYGQDWESASAKALELLDK